MGGPHADPVAAGPAGAAATLTRIEPLIPGSAEVIVSQGVVGRFANRADVRILLGPGYQPVSRKDVWFIVLPTSASRPRAPAARWPRCRAGRALHARMVTHANGVWVFDWHPPAGVTRVQVPGLAPIPAWTTPGSGGRAVLDGQLGRWDVTSTGQRGYVVSGLAWRSGRGATGLLRLSSTGPVNVEIWDDNSNQLLARQMAPGTDGIERITVPVDATVPYRSPAVLLAGGRSAPTSSPRPRASAWNRGSGHPAVRPFMCTAPPLTAPESRAR